MSDRRGSALLAVMWVLVALGLVAAGGLTATSLGGRASVNRITLRRAAWAAEACAAIALSRYKDPLPLLRLDSVDLGDELWCRMRVDDPGARLPLDAPDEAVLQQLLEAPARVDALLDWQDPDEQPRPHGAERPAYAAAGLPGPANRPFSAVGELRDVLGFAGADSTWLEQMFSVGGTGRIDLATASSAVLDALPWFTASDRAIILATRRAGTPIADWSDLLERSDPARRQQLGSLIPDLALRIVFRPEQLILHAEGRVGTSPLTAGVELTVIPDGRRLAIIRRIPR